MTAVLLNNRLSLPIISHPFFDLFGFILLTAGMLLHLPSAHIFKVIGKGTPVPIEPPKKLVRVGLYKYSRNPMYLGIFLILLGGFFIFGHFLLLIYALLFFLFFHFYIILVEEPKLKERFGQDYFDYLKTVPRWGLRINIFK